MSIGARWKKGADRIVRCPIPSFRNSPTEPVSPKQDRRWKPEPERGEAGLAAAKLHPQFDRGQPAAISNHAEQLVNICGRSELAAWARQGRQISEERLHDSCRKSPASTIHMEVWGARATTALAHAGRIAADEILRRARLADAVLDQLRRGSAAGEDYAVLGSRHRRTGSEAVDRFSCLDLLAGETDEATEQVLTIVGEKWFRLAANGYPVAIGEAGGDAGLQSSPPRHEAAPLEDAGRDDDVTPSWPPPAPLMPAPRLSIRGRTSHAGWQHAFQPAPKSGPLKGRFGADTQPCHERRLPERAVRNNHAAANWTDRMHTLILRQDIPEA